LRRLRPEAKWLDGRPPHQHAIDVADWLRTLSLDEYAPQFSGNHITDDLLPKLTADGLKGLGVNSVGHRRRLPDGIALLRDKTDTAAPGKNDELPAKQYDTDPSERWQVTLRINGPHRISALSKLLDAAEIEGILMAFFRSCRRRRRRTWRHH
jgi:SAM (Sterile alpha motif) domain-containing protein